MHTDIQGQHSIWLPSTFLILQWMWELEWAKHILDFPPKECTNVKCNITIFWDVPLEFRNWYVNVSYQTAMVRYNWKCISKLLHTDIQVQYYIWLPSAFLTLQWMWVLEWAKHILGCWAAWLWISPHQGMQKCQIQYYNIMRRSIGIQKVISFYQTWVRSLHTLVSYYSNSCKVDSTGGKILKWWLIFYVQRWNKTRFYQRPKKFNMYITRIR